MMAANCDVIGFDYYVPTFLSAAVDSLIRAANKPVMIGEYSFPSSYNGMRGLRSFQTVATSSDAESGDRYTQWLQDTSAAKTTHLAWWTSRTGPSTIWSTKCERPTWQRFRAWVYSNGRNPVQLNFQACKLSI